MSDDVTPAEEQAILADFDRITSEPPPTDPAAVGCIAALVALVGLVALPLLSRWLPLSGGAIRLLAIALGAVFVLGALPRIFGVGLIRFDVDKEIDALRSSLPGRSQAAQREAAVRLLGGAYYSRGPATVHTFDTEEVARRLGPALAYVLQIERVLLRNQRIYAVFTGGEGPQGTNATGDATP